MSVPSIFAAPSMVCTRCDGTMVITKNAIGVERLRCPRCDRVTAKHYHPDEVLVPQTLVRPDRMLPLVRPGQLRCQRCAKGVEGNGRLCPACHGASKKRAAVTRLSRGPATYAPKACATCGATFQPDGPNSRYCDPCLTPEQRASRDRKRVRTTKRRRA